jgi:hypothetical protein
LNNLPPDENSIPNNVELIMQTPEMMPFVYRAAYHVKCNRYLTPLHLFRGIMSPREVMLLSSTVSTVASVFSGKLTPKNDIEKYNLSAAMLSCQSLIQALMLGSGEPYLKMSDLPSRFIVLSRLSIGYALVMNGLAKIIDSNFEIMQDPSLECVTLLGEDPPDQSTIESKG